MRVLGESSPTEAHLTLVSAEPKARVALTASSGSSISLNLVPELHRERILLGVRGIASLTHESATSALVEPKVLARASEAVVSLSPLLGETLGPGRYWKRQIVPFSIWC